MTRLEKFYNDTVKQQLQEKFNFASAMQIPKVTKITLNMGIGEAAGDKKIVEHATRDMELITGQNRLLRCPRKR